MTPRDTITTKALRLLVSAGVLAACVALEATLRGVALMRALHPHRQCLRCGWHRPAEHVQADGVCLLCVAQDRGAA